MLAKKLKNRTGISSMGSVLVEEGRGNLSHQKRHSSSVHLRITTGIQKIPQLLTASVKLPFLRSGGGGSPMAYRVCHFSQISRECTISLFYSLFKLLIRVASQVSSSGSAKGSVGYAPSRRSGGKCRISRGVARGGVTPLNRRRFRR